MSYRKPRFLVVIGALAATGLLASCASSAANSNDSEKSNSPEKGGTLIFATGDAEPSCLDPAVPGNVPQALLGTQIIETLLYQDEDGELHPWLAKDWEVSDDQLEYAFTTQENIVFADGEPFDAEAIKRNIDWMKDPNTGSSTAALALKKVDKVTVEDEQTAVIHLSEPDAALLESLGHIWLPIQSPKALDRGVEENCKQPVGTGPFKVVEWARQSHILLERNELYSTPPPEADHQGVAYLDKVEWRFLPDDTSRFAALLSGDVHVIDRVPPESVSILQDRENLEQLQRSRPGVPEVLYLNSSKAPFDDVAVREAFVRSVDLDAGIASVLLNTVERTDASLSSTTKFNKKLHDEYAYDLERANNLLDEAGWEQRDTNGYRVKDGEQLTVDFMVNADQTTSAQKGLFEQIQATAKDAGFNVAIRPIDLASRSAETAANNYNITTGYYTKNSADVLRIVFHSSSNEVIGGYRANVSQINDPELDAALEAAGATLDPEERGKQYEIAQKIIADGYYIVPTYDQETRLGYDANRIHGLKLAPAVSMPTLYDVWLDS